MTESKNSHITILGTGTSTGVPVINCDCKVCTSQNPKNKRLRTSIVLKTPHKNILIDVSQDFRTQILRSNITQIDGVIITHGHADHTQGLDDLRPYTFSPKGRELPVLTNAETAEDLERRFSYIFKRTKESSALGGGVARLNLETFPHPEQSVTSKINFLGEDFEFLRMPHGKQKTSGTIYKNFAYLVDLNHLEAEQIHYLRDKNLDLLIIDCLRWKPHQTHLHVDLALSYIKQIRPKRAGLTHFGHQIDHQEMLKYAQDHSVEGCDIFPLYDQMELTLQ